MAELTRLDYLDKVAHFLVKRFDCILLSTFETSHMATKAKRNIRSKTVRHLLTFAHDHFKANDYGKSVLDVCQAYTSKTHPETDELHKIGSAKRIQLTNGQWINRDEVGARNSLLRTLVDTPDNCVVAVAHRSF
jgi:putative transposase